MRGSYSSASSTQGRSLARVAIAYWEMSVGPLERAHILSTSFNTSRTTGSRCVPKTLHSSRNSLRFSRIRFVEAISLDWIAGFSILQLCANRHRPKLNVQ